MMELASTEIGRDVY